MTVKRFIIIVFIISIYKSLEKQQCVDKTWKKLNIYSCETKPVIPKFSVAWQDTGKTTFVFPPKRNKKKKKC